MGSFCFVHAPYPRPFTRTLQLTTARDCFGVVMTGARGLKTCNKNKEKRMCRVTPLLLYTHSRCRAPGINLFPSETRTVPSRSLRLLLNFQGWGVCTNYLPNSHQISSLLAANTKKLTSRKMNVDWASWLAYTCTRLWIQTSTAN